MKASDISVFDVKVKLFVHAMSEEYQITAKEARKAVIETILEDL